MKSQRFDVSDPTDLGWQAERDQALLQSLLAQIDSLIAARDEDELFSVVCTRLIETGLFLGAFVLRPGQQDQPETLYASEQTAELLAGLSNDDNHALNQSLADALAQADGGAVLPLFDPLAKPFSKVSWQSATPASLYLPLWRLGQQEATLPWAFLVVIGVSRQALDNHVSAVLKRLGELVNKSLEQLDLRIQLDREKSRHAYLALHDPLTGLANRRAIEQELPRAASRAKRHNTLLAVVLFDLDDFKPVNDQHGHAAGDFLLKTLAKRLQKTVRETDTAGRMGGDEFLLLLEDLEDVDAVNQVLSRVARVVSDPVILPNGARVAVQASMGVSCAPLDDSEPEQLIRNADAALYIAKNQKSHHFENWVYWSKARMLEFTAQQNTMEHTDPYGDLARDILNRMNSLSLQVAEQFVDAFYQQLESHDTAYLIIARLSEEEYSRLKRSQCAHLQTLLHPELSEQNHRAYARSIGRAHALTGVPASALVRAITIYMHQFNQTFAETRLTLREQNLLERILIERLSAELSEQLDAAQLVADNYNNALITLDERKRDTPYWTEFNERLIDVLHGLPGIKAAAIHAPNTKGTFAISFARGPEALNQALTQIPPTLDPGFQESNSPVARSFRFEQVERVNSMQEDPTVAPWCEVATDCGIRSCVAIPITNRVDQPTAVITLYGEYVGQFDSQILRSFCEQLKALVSLAWRQTNQSQPLLFDKKEHDRWREAFYTGGLVMYYQPVIDSVTGELCKIEALARLHLHDHQVIAPGLFIPSLNQGQLQRLYEQALIFALREVKKLRSRAHTSVKASVNMPLSVLLNEQTIIQTSNALEQIQLPADALDIEILEDSEAGYQLEEIALAMYQLRKLGIGLTMDDLGAGFSNLLRLRKLPFTGVKIDQGMVRSVHQDPYQVLTYMASMIQMSRALDLEVVVEGLETQDLIEAAAILEAPQGQGYAIARPLPPDQLMGFVRGINPLANPQTPQTALGALAVLWRLYMLLRDNLVRTQDFKQHLEGFLIWADTHAPSYGLKQPLLKRIAELQRIEHLDADTLNHIIQELDLLVREQHQPPTEQPDHSIGMRGGAQTHIA